MDEVGAHRADQRLQRPDACPFADGITECHALGGEKSDQHVVHVAAVVHHEHHGRLRVDRGERLRIGIAEAHTIEELRAALGQPVADAKVEVGVERRHDLARIDVGALACQLERHVLLGGVG